MDALRCVRCDAVLLEDAPWCSLCFEPVAAAAPATVAPVPLAPAMTPERAAAIIAALPPGVDQAQELVLVAAGLFAADTVAQDGAGNLPGVPAEGPAMTSSGRSLEGDLDPAAAADPRTWPCMRCGARVPLAESDCPQCGAAFMGGVGPVAIEVKVPLLAKIVSMPRGQAIVAAGVLGFVVAATCVGLLWLIADLL